MLLGSKGDFICLRRLLTDVGDREAPNAVSRSEAFLGVLPVAVGLLSLGDGALSMNVKKYEEEETKRVVHSQVSGNHK